MVIDLSAELFLDHLVCLPLPVQVHRGLRFRRSEAALARAALTRRDLDAALSAAHRAVDLSTTVQSSRCIAAVRDLQSRISPYRTIASARDFDDRAHEVLTRASLN